MLISPCKEYDQRDIFGGPSAAEYLRQPGHCDTEQMSHIDYLLECILANTPSAAIWLPVARRAFIGIKPFDYESPSAKDSISRKIK